MARQRGIMALIGAMAAGSLYLLGQMIAADWLAGRFALAAVVCTGVFFAGLLITAGPLKVARGFGGGGRGGWGSSTRHPRLGAFCEPGRDSGDLDRHDCGGRADLVAVAVSDCRGSSGLARLSHAFRRNWGIVVRVTVALVFTGIVWVVIFLIALPLRGFDTIFGAVSSSALFLATVAVAVTLVTSVLDAEDATATHSRMMVQSTRILAAITVLPGGLAAWSLALRISAYGWTPARLLAATTVVLALAYGVFYLIAVLRGAFWMERIRQANIWMALAVLWLTFLNPEAISARSQTARIADGRTKVEAIELAAFQNWGPAGRAALDRLKGLAKDNAVLQARLTASTVPDTAESDPAAVQKALAVAMPVQPATPEAQVLRDRILA